MSRERWQKAMWEEFLSRIFRVDHVSFFPHKIFRWDKMESIGIVISLFPVNIF